VESFFPRNSGKKEASREVLKSRLCIAFTSSCALSSAQVPKNEDLGPLAQGAERKNYSRAVERDG